MGNSARVWVTRAEPGASHTADRLRAAGHVPLVAPLLEVRPLSRVQLDFAGVGALAFTSANAVRAFAKLSSRRDLAVYAVGEATAEAAKEAGLPLQRAGDGGVEAMAALIVDDPQRPPGAVLHPSAREPAGDLMGRLREAGVEGRSVAVYETSEVTRLPAAADEALRAGRLDAILLHSPRGARALARLLHVTRLEFKCDGIDGLGLSPACLVPVQSLRLRSRKSPEHPRESSLLALIEGSRTRKMGPVLWVGAGVATAVVAALGAVLANR